jgi:transcription elongation GreA/GreB family factor
MFSKESLKEELRRLLAGDLATREAAWRAAREGATHEEAKPENDKDTRALEQSYLARGEAKRVEQLRAAVAAVEGMALRAFGAEDPIALSAVVTVEEGEDTIVFFMAPEGGGTKLGGGRVQVVTPEAPLGRALLGKRAGDEALVVAGARRRELAIVSVE